VTDPVFSLALAVPIDYAIGDIRAGTFPAVNRRNSRSLGNNFIGSEGLAVFDIGILYGFGSGSIEREELI